MAVPSLSVIIPTLNEASTIQKLLGDLAAQTTAPDEVLVVDAGSKDGTAALVRKQRGAQLITTSPGVGAQRRLGGEKAHSEVLVFLDADVRLDKNFIEHSLTEFTNKKLACACPRYQPVTNLLGVKLLFFLLNGLFFFGQQHFPAGAGPCIIVKRAAFKKLGGFRSDILVDDLDFVHRAGKAFRFGIIGTRVYVSDRRFQTFGVLTTTLQYLHISWHFVRGRLIATNSINYVFGKFR